jgi:hypothetical protein
MAVLAGVLLAAPIMSIIVVLQVAGIPANGLI